MELKQTNNGNLPAGVQEPDRNPWFSTPGDIDDFIFFWEDGSYSGK